MKEVLVKDKDGAWRIWRDGQWLPAEPPVDQKTTLPSTEFFGISAATGGKVPSPPETASAPPSPAASAQQSVDDILSVQQSVNDILKESEVLAPLAVSPAPLAEDNAQAESPIVSVAPLVEEDDKEAPVLARSEDKKSYQTPQPAVDEMADRVERVTKKIMREISVSNMDVSLRGRLENAISSRLREVRDTVDTRDMFLKKLDAGGLEMTDDIADEIIGVILKYLPEIHRPIGEINDLSADSAGEEGLSKKLSDLTAEALADTGIDKIISSSLSSAPKEGAAEEMKARGAESAPVGAPMDIAPDDKKSTIAAEQPPTAVGITEEKEKSSEAKEVLKVSADEKKAVLGAKPPRKPSMTDVHSKPSAVGPIDELRLFTAADFRRLDADPQRAISRLKDKIKLLEEESYAKMAEGVKAWRVSPLNQLYLTIGRESLEADKNVAEIIRQRQNAGQAALSEEEFGALLDLNKKIRF